METAMNLDLWERNQSLPPEVRAVVQEADKNSRIANLFHTGVAGGAGGYPDGYFSGRPGGEGGLSYPPGYFAAPERKITIADMLPGVKKSTTGRNVYPEGYFRAPERRPDIADVLPVSRKPIGRYRTALDKFMEDTQDLPGQSVLDLFMQATDGLEEQNVRDNQAWFRQRPPDATRTSVTKTFGAQRRPGSFSENLLRDLRKTIAGR